MVEPTAKRLGGDYFITTYKMKERQACRLVNLAISSKRYCKKVNRADQAIKEQLTRLARAHIRYGYRRLTACLNNKGIMINHKKVYRLYKEENLKYEQKKR